MLDDSELESDVNTVHDDDELSTTDNIVSSSTRDAAEYVLSLRKQGLTHDCVAAVISPLKHCWKELLHRLRDVLVLS